MRDGACFRISPLLTGRRFFTIAPGRLFPGKISRTRVEKAPTFSPDRADAINGARCPFLATQKKNTHENQYHKLSLHVMDSGYARLGCKIRLPDCRVSLLLNSKVTETSLRMRRGREPLKEPFVKKKYSTTTHFPGRSITEGSLRGSSDGQKLTREIYRKETPTYRKSRPPMSAHPSPAFHR